MQPRGEYIGQPDMCKLANTKRVMFGITALHHNGKALTCCFLSFFVLGLAGMGVLSGAGT